MDPGLGALWHRISRPSTVSAAAVHMGAGMGGGIVENNPDPSHTDPFVGITPLVGIWRSREISRKARIEMEVYRSSLPLTT